MEAVAATDALRAARTPPDPVARLQKAWPAFVTAAGNDLERAEQEMNAALAAVYAVIEERGK